MQAGVFEQKVGGLDAYNGATVLVVANGELTKVSNTERVVLRSLEPYGTLKPGTHIKITKKTQLFTVD